MRAARNTMKSWTKNIMHMLAASALFAAAVVVGGETEMNLDLRIDWPTFLARHDMLWTKLPGNWREAPWTGNGMLGSMIWQEDGALRMQVFRGDVQAHRPMTQGTSAFTRGRLQIGSFYLKTSAKPVDCDLRLSLHDAGGIVKGSIEQTANHEQRFNMDVNLENGGGNTEVLPPSKAAMKFDDALARQWANDHGKQHAGEKDR